MDSDIKNINILAHISGLTEKYKHILLLLLKKSKIYNNIKIIDIDIISDKIINDNNIKLLENKYENQISLKKNKTSIQELKKKIYLYWKVKLEYYINKIAKESLKKILLIGNLHFYKDHKIYLNLSINNKFFVNIDPILYGKSTIEYNIDNYKNDIINGNFNINLLDLNFIIQKRISIEHLYKKIFYFNMSLSNIINIIELLFQINTPNVLYFTSFNKYDKKIPIIKDYVFCYIEEWLSLTSLVTDILKKIYNNKYFIILNNKQYNELNKSCYIYEIIDTSSCLPYPTNNIYKYISVKPLKINRSIFIDNIINQIKKLKIDIIIK